MSGNPLVSVIVPCKELDGYARECIEHCKRLGYENYEVVLLPDRPLSKDLGNVKVVPTGPVTPGAKRNIGVANSKGDICAFIDSDAYPRVDWLRNAVMYFNDPGVGVVGGPGLTPQNDSILQKASGYVTSSLMVGGLSRRYKPGKLKEVDDIHSCNFMARRSVIKEAGGWNERYWPGEDTLMCLAIKKAGFKIVQTSDVVVYHHRRPLFTDHLLQVSRFGLHRGFFAREFGGNSLHLTYFAPSIALMMLVLFSVLSTFVEVVTYLVVVALGSYLAASLFSTLLETRDRRVVPVVWAGIMLTHLTYGAYFIAGLIKHELRK